MSLNFQNVETTLGKTKILKGASLSAADGKLTGIVGPNGSGKSTLIRTLFSLANLDSGVVMVNDTDIKRMSRKQLARCVGYVGQEMNCSFDFTVKEVVAMGCFPQTWADRTKRAIKNSVDDALAALGISEFAERSILTLSGGEKKMAFLARAVAQGVRTIVLDEPTNHLDIKHQLFILDYLKNSGKTILLVIHDLTLAVRYCDILYLMHSGRTVAHGTPETVLTRRNVRDVFGVNGSVHQGTDGRHTFLLD
jgi:iron complex transport system ATP-binding protein